MKVLLLFSWIQVAVLLRFCNFVIINARKNHLATEVTVGSGNKMQTLWNNNLLLNEYKEIKNKYLIFARKLIEQELRKKIIIFCKFEQLVYFNEASKDSQFHYYWAIYYFLKQRTNKYIIDNFFVTFFLKIGTWSARNLLNFALIFHKLCF